jgi:hypothetical protein
MRHLSPAVLGLGAILLLSGCADSKWSLFRHSPDSARLPVDKVPTAAQLVTYQNNNARQIQSLVCPDLDLDCQQGIQKFHIRGKLACQKPRNFRMQAEALAKTEADIGSNDQEFWYWIARGEPYLVHCSYQDLASGVRIPFPFQPDWIMAALGMSEYDGDPSQYVVQQGKGATIELLQTTRNAQGQVVRKVTVFTQSASRLQVTDHIIQGVGGNEICRAHLSEVQEIAQGVVLPRKIVFSYPAEQLRLTLTLWHRLDEVTRNQPFDSERARVLFTRPALSGVQSYDLARGPDGINQVRPAGGLHQR